MGVRGRLNVKQGDVVLILDDRVYGKVEDFDSTSHRWIIKTAQGIRNLLRCEFHKSTLLPRRSQKGIPKRTRPGLDRLKLKEVARRMDAEKLASRSC